VGAVAGGVGGVQPPAGIQSLSQATLIELGTPQAQTLPSPASDATTSTKDTVTPSALVSKVKKPVMPRLLPRNDEDKKEEEKTSTVTVTKKPRGRPRKELVQGPLIQGMLAGSELDMDSEDDGDIGAEGEEGKKNKNVVKLSAILPKNMGKGLTPASSSKKGSSLTSVKSTNQKATPKRKRMEDGILDPIAKGKKSRKLGGSDSEEIDEMEQKWPFPCDLCNSGFDRRLQLENHMRIHHETSSSREKSVKINISQQDKERANKQLTTPERPEPLPTPVLVRKTGITQSALKTARTGRENYDQIQAATEVTGSGRVRKMKKMFDL